MTHPFQIVGENKPSPVRDFPSSGLATVLLENVRRAKYSVLTPVQKHGLAIIREGRDLMACAQTGSGKTAAFLLPILHKILATRCVNDVTLRRHAASTPSQGAVRRGHVHPGAPGRGHHAHQGARHPGAQISSSGFL